MQEVTPLTSKELYSRYSRSELNNILENIRTLAVSPDADKASDAWLQYMSVLDINVDIEKTTLPEMGAIVNSRVSKLPKLQETYFVLMLGRNIHSLLSEEKSSNSFSIENISSSAKCFYSAGIINDEQMARVYYSIGQLYSKYELSKNYNANPQRAARYIDKYALKALSLTGDMEMINACINDISEASYDKRIEFTLEACERALKSPNQKDYFAKFQIYSLCGSCYQEKAKLSTITYKKDNDVYRRAAIYYQAALRYSLTDDDTEKTLRNLSKVQKMYDSTGYLATRVKLLSYLEGKDKVIEAIKIASSESITTKNKERLLEVAANELIDSSVLADEKILLWQNIKQELSSIYGDDKRKCSKLEKIDSKYFKSAKKGRFNIANIKSSKGNNHFRR